MDRYPLVSIVTVCKNSEKTIERTILSVANQDYEGEIEYIIVDGKSTDRTINVIEKYKENIQTIVSEKDSGLYDAMNKGIRIASGEIIGIINSDDWYENNAVRLSVDNIIKNAVDISYGKMRIRSAIHKDGERFFVGDLKDIWFSNPIGHPTAFIKKNIYTEYGYYDLRYKVLADYYLLLNAYANGATFSFCDAVIANFSEGGYSYKNKGQSYIELFGIAKEIAEKTGIKYGEIKKNIEKGIAMYRVGMAECFVKDYRNLAYGVLSEYIKEPYSILGMGKWGNIMLQIFSEYGYLPEFVTDNNIGKNDLRGINQIFTPDILRNYEGTVFVCIRNKKNEIDKQLVDLGVKRIVYIDDIMNDLAKEYYNLEISAKINIELLDEIDCS